MDFFQSVVPSSSKKSSQAKNATTNGHGHPQSSSSKPKSSKSNVVVSTIKRKVIPRPVITKASTTPYSQDGSRTGSPAANALPAEVRARIEAARAAEQEREIEREAEAQVRRSVSKHKGDKKSDTAGKSKKRRQDDFLDSEEEAGSRSNSKARKSRVSKVVGDDDDLFGSGDESRSSSRPILSRKPSRKAMTPQQSTPSAYTYLGRSGVVQPYLVPRTLIPADEHPEPTFVEFVEEFGRPKSAAVLVEEAMAKSSGRAGRWGPFFKDLPVSPPPQCTLHYPAEGAIEDFTLLVPRDADEYDPISDLLRSVYVIVKHYLTDEQRQHFGELSELEVNSMAGQIWSGPLHLDGANEAGEASALNGGETSSPATPAHTVAHHSVLANLASPPTTSSSGANTPLHTPGGSTTAAFETSSILRSFSKSRNRRNGHLFLHTVTRFNNAILDLQASGAIKKNITALGETGVPEDVWGRIQDQAYARSVAPRVDELASYRSFSDNVYGELTPRFMSEIAQLCDLKPSSVMVDLGCGVGNLVIQTALQVGCKSYGIEAMPTPAELGVLQVEEAKKRWKMWGLQGGDMKVWKGDFLEDEEIREYMRRADVVIVNNYAFTPPLNGSLSLLFLDLPEHCKIVSLKPFVPPDFRLTQRTIGSSSAILSVQEREYGKGMVSWTERGGKYYIAQVDRSLVKRFIEEEQQASGAVDLVGVSSPRKRKVEEGAALQKETILFAEEEVETPSLP